MTTLQDVAVAVARIDERQAAMAASLERIEEQLVPLSKRIDALEIVNRRLVYGAAGASFASLLTLGKLNSDVVISILQALLS
jgi:hypothetical protein